MIKKYHVVLKDKSVSYEIADKIRNIELEAYNDRFPVEEAIEVYCSGSEEQCLQFISKLDDDLKPIFYVIKDLHNG